MTLLDELKILEPRFKDIRRMPLENEAGQVVAWNAYAYTESGLCLAGGTASNFGKALRVCVAELFERKLIQRIHDRGLTEAFHLDSHPTSCGFAAGFDARATAQRSLCEAIERWAWSKWIDEGCEPQSFGRDPVPRTELLRRHLGVFQDVVYFRHRFSFLAQDYDWGVVIGLTSDGAFAGSRVCARTESPWEHAAIEAYRSYRNALHFTQNPQAAVDDKNIIHHRTLHFATRKQEALRQISAAKNPLWPPLRLENFRRKSYDTGIDGLYLIRSLFTDYLPWNEGPVQRFVY